MGEEDEVGQVAAHPPATRTTRLSDAERWGGGRCHRVYARGEGLQQGRSVRMRTQGEGLESRRRGEMDWAPACTSAWGREWRRQGESACVAGPEGALGAGAGCWRLAQGSRTRVPRRRRRRYSIGGVLPKW
jgi:hypothetical protein